MWCSMGVGIIKPAGECEQVFVDLVAEHQDGVYSGLLRLTGSVAQAQDLAQDTFLAAWRSLLKMDPKRRRQLNRPAWVWTIAINLWRNTLRTKSRRPATTPLGPLSARVADPEAGPEQRALAVEAGSELAAMLLELAPDIRVTLVLRYLADLDYAEVAAATGVPEGTARSRVSRGLESLRRLRKEVA